jgi:outer membrane protein assembly complex protein YaeT
MCAPLKAPRLPAWPERSRGPTGTLLLLLLLVPVQAAAEVAEYLGKPIASIRLQIEGRPIADDRLRRLVRLKEGSPLTMLVVRETVAHLFSLGEFEDVQVDATSRGDGVDLLFELAPIHPVTRVLFTGVAGVPGADEGRLRSAVLDRFGASPSPGRAQDIARLVEAELGRRGYLHPRVTPRLELEHAPDRATLVLAVEPGARTTVGAVEVIGAPGIPERELLERLGITPGVPYQPELLATRIENYLRGRRDRGYYEARLAALPRFADEDRTVNLSLDAVQGPRVRIVFTGEQLPGDVRDELVPIAREGSTDEDLLEDSTNRIRDYLHAQGYRDAQVSHQRSQEEGELVVSFAIERGQRYRLAAVTLEGNQFFPTLVLEPQLRLGAGQPFDGARLEADVSAIQELYRRRGFASAEVDAVVERVASGAGETDVALGIRIVIVEHAQTIVQSVVVEGNTAVSEVELTAGLGLRPGAEFFATQLAIDRDAVQSRYANLGFLHATVESEPGVSADGRSANIVFRVREGPQIFVEHVLVVGNRRTRPETIERELQVKAGDAMGQDAVIETQRRMTALGLFRRTRITQLSHGDENRRDLLITVEEAPPTTVGYGGGFEVGPQIQETDGVADEALEFWPRAFFEITRRNLFGKNRSVNLFTRISLRARDDSTGEGFTEYRVLGTFREPRVFNTAADAFLTAVVEQQHRSSFNFARRGFNAELVRRFTPAFSVIGSYQINDTEVFDEKIDPDDQPFIDQLFPQVLLSSFAVAGIHDTRNDQLNPSGGHYVSANGQVAAKAIGSEVGLLKSYYTAQAFRMIPRTNRLVFAGSARLGLATAFARVPDGAADDPDLRAGVQLPASERFFAGGDTTVRGFALDRLGTPEVIDANGFPVGGNGVVILNAELRLRLMRSLGVVGFLDTGNVFKQATDVDLSRLRSAAGFGLRFQSPVGPIRVDLGFKINRQEITPGRLEDANAWHISLGQAF